MREQRMVVYKEGCGAQRQVGVLKVKFQIQVCHVGDPFQEAPCSLSSSPVEGHRCSGSALSCEMN